MYKNILHIKSLVPPDLTCLFTVALAGMGVGVTVACGSKPAVLML